MKNNMMLKLSLIIFNYQVQEHVADIFTSPPLQFLFRWLSPMKKFAVLVTKLTLMLAKQLPILLKIEASNPKNKKRRQKQTRLNKFEATVSVAVILCTE